MRENKLYVKVSEYVTYVEIYEIFPARENPTLDMRLILNLGQSILCSD